ncbi:TetR/AcrR family transcriptional regulator [Prosthecobacter fluviatilis]|uniref:TetR/AcrR family transcriptional regulator n=1 Tax=Prosthecobacter fluviatilis TaxID=445931 RepID=A0ABW0KKD2_9BACT
MKKKTAAKPPRDYQQTARAEAAEASTRRIIEAFLKRAETEWFDKIKLDDIAADAGVTVQTVVRKFGSKMGLLEVAHKHMGESVAVRRVVVPGDLDSAIDALTRDYEDVGPLVLRLLDQEQMHPVLKPTLDVGRRGHRDWLQETFAERLKPLTPARREATLDALVVAADIYVWKLIRLDMGRSIPAYKQVVRQMILAALEPR